MGAAKSVEAQHSKSTSREHELRNERLALGVMPGCGCHWTHLRLSVKGAWLDFLEPAQPPRPGSNRPQYGSFVMAPWTNRIDDGIFEFGGERFQLERSGADGTAIHGDVRGQPWEVVTASDTAFEATLDSREVEGFNFPYALTFCQTLSLDDERLVARVVLKNVDSRPAPVGCGFHPYLRRRLSLADNDVIVQLAADSVYPLRNCLPTGPAQAVDGRRDLREQRFLGAPDLDDCYTALGAEFVRLIYPGSRVEVRFHLESAFSHVVVYAPNREPGVPQDFVAVEPVTQVNNGFQLAARGWEDTGVVVLEPGVEWAAGFEISFGDI